jgi:glucan phosphoethanolaminetransferase (alkaline phosphatase superfamily)
MKKKIATGAMPRKRPPSQTPTRKKETAQHSVGILDELLKKTNYAGVRILFLGILILNIVIITFVALDSKLPQLLIYIAPAYMFYKLCIALFDISDASIFTMKETEMNRVYLNQLIAEQRKSNEINHQILGHQQPPS